LGNTYKDRRGYPRWRDSGKLVHRTIMGPIGKGKVVHHKDGNKSNFRKSNLTVMGKRQHSSLHARKRRRF